MPLPCDRSNPHTRQPHLLQGGYTDKAGNDAAYLYCNICTGLSADGLAAIKQATGHEVRCDNPPPAEDRVTEVAAPAEPGNVSQVNQALGGGPTTQVNQAGLKKRLR